MASSRLTRAAMVLTLTAVAAGLATPADAARRARLGADLEQKLAQGSQAIQQAAPHAPEQMLADAGLGGIYTNPLSSKVIRWAIGAAIALLCSKVFKYTASDAQMQDWIELGCGLLSLAVIAYHRLKSTNTIMSLQDATTMFVSHFSTIDNRIVQRDVLNALQQKNPKLYANVKTVLQFFSH